MHGIGVIGSCRWSDVELLARERLPDARDRARAEDDVRQRAVRRHDHRAADRDHVRRRIAVAAVPRMQHARELAGRVVAHDRLHLDARARAALRTGARRARRRRPRRTTSTARRSRPSSAPIIVGGPCASAHHTTARSSGSRCRPSARSPRSRSTCWSTRRSSAIWAARSSPRSGSPGAVLGGAFAIFNFLAYGTTAVVARASGAGQHERAARLAAQALWVSLGIGARARRRARGVAAEPLLRALGATGGRATTRSSTSGSRRSGCRRRSSRSRGRATCAASRTCGGRSRSSSPRTSSNVVLEVLFVYGFHWGIAGSAAGTAIAQAGMGVAFVVELLRPHAESRRPSLREIAPDAADRRPDLRAHDGAARRRSSSRASVLARMGDAQLGAHQIAFQLFYLPRAGARRRRDRGAGDRRPDARRGRRGGRVRVGGADDRRGRCSSAPSSRSCSCRSTHALPRAFSGDHAVLKQAAILWPFFALMQPLGGAVFALDGILIGAGDTRLPDVVDARRERACSSRSRCSRCSSAGASSASGSALDVLIAARLALLGVRFPGKRWAVVGWG